MRACGEKSLSISSGPGNSRRQKALPRISVKAATGLGQVPTLLHRKAVGGLRSGIQARGKALKRLRCKCCGLFSSKMAGGLNWVDWGRGGIRGLRSCGEMLVPISSRLKNRRSKGSIKAFGEGCGRMARFPYLRRKAGLRTGAFVISQKNPRRGTKRSS